MSWEKQDFVAKAKLFANYADELEVNDPRFPLWRAFTLEMLARATLAQFNPCLLADIRQANDETAANLFFACGIRIGNKAPISVGVSTVFKRCKVLMSDFTENEVGWCNEFLIKRNEELHSGASAYSLYPPEKWLADYYRISAILLRYLTLDLADIFGSDTAAVAVRLIADQSAYVKKQIVELIQSAKVLLSGLTPEEEVNRKAKMAAPGLDEQKVKCPTGDHDCIVSGEITNISPPRLDEDNNIVILRNILPTRLSCTICGLQLASYSALVEAGVGAPFKVTIVEDPISFHGINVLEHITEEEAQEFLADRYEPDYGND